jgi:hypothetical protein
MGQLDITLVESRHEDPPQFRHRKLLLVSFRHLVIFAKIQLPHLNELRQKADLLNHSKEVKNEVRGKPQH